MKPLVGKNLRDLKTYLRLADWYLARAEKLSFGAYGSHGLTSGIRSARRETRFGFYQFKDEIFVINCEGQIKPPLTPKVKRMLLTYEEEAKSIGRHFVIQPCDNAAIKREPLTRPVENVNSGAGAALSAPATAEKSSAVGDSAKLHKTDNAYAMMRAVNRGLVALTTMWRNGDDGSK